MFACPDGHSHRFDVDGRLHRDTGPAHLYVDNEGVRLANYYLNGAFLKALPTDIMLVRDAATGSNYLKTV